MPAGRPLRPEQLLRRARATLTLVPATARPAGHGPPARATLRRYISMPWPRPPLLRAVSTGRQGVVEDLPSGLTGSSRRPSRRCTVAGRAQAPCRAPHRPRRPATMIASAHFAGGVENRPRPPEPLSTWKAELSRSWDPRGCPWRKPCDSRFRRRHHGDLVPTRDLRVPPPTISNVVIDQPEAEGADDQVVQATVHRLRAVPRRGRRHHPFHLRGPRATCSFPYGEASAPGQRPRAGDLVYKQRRGSAHPVR